MKKKTSIILAVLLLAVLVLLFLLLRGRSRGHRLLTIDETPVIVTSIRNLGELTTACFYDEVVISDTKSNALSSTQLGSLAREMGRDLDDHLVIIARGTVRAGMDLRRITAQDIRIQGDTVTLRLPYPQYLDIIINPTDFEVFAESGRWTQQQVSNIQERARKKLLREAEEAGLTRKAYDGAVEAVTDLLTACGYTCIRLDQPGYQIRMPGEVPVPLP